MELYIYDDDTKEIIAIVKGKNNEDCEKKAADLPYDQDYGWAYDDNGLTGAENAERY